jgi:diguanylate cyclase (GGDEF)-like protein/PAS domain S-box-containing protein
VTEARESASRRLMVRLLHRAGLSEITTPDQCGWLRVLDMTQSLLEDLEQDRYLLEQSLDTSSEEMLLLNEELHATAERLEVEREDLNQTNSLLAATLESTADGILVADGAGGITSFNGRFAEMWGLPEDILASRDDNVALGHVLGSLRDPATFIAKVHELYADPSAASHDIIELEDGRTFERDSLPQRIDGQVVGRVWSFRDVTEHLRLQRELSHQALHDHLTDLANRTLLGDRINQALRRTARTGELVAVIVVDLDGFKTINDSLGHSVGDSLLVAVADRFRRILRDFDTIARIGGDEFAMLVDGLDTPESVGRIGRRILDALTDPVEAHGRRFAISASVGIAVGSDPGRTPDELVGNADVAMYRAKRDGKNCYRIFDTSMQVMAMERLDLEQAFRDAVSSRSLTVEYQPVVATDTGHVVSFEALARWRSPDRGDVAPDVFIPLAEEIGLILDLGRWVLFEACHQARIWRTTFPDISPTVAVNVSRLQLVDPGFINDVASALAEADLDPSSLTIEITESILSADPVYVIGVLEKVRNCGVRIAVDDFGTGYSSLAALAELPADTLKIDKRFIDNLLRNDHGRRFVETIIQLARSLGLDTVAEGVERPDQHDMLRTLGCDYIQGFLFAQPLSMDDVCTYIESNRVGVECRIQHDLKAINLS